MSTYATNTTQSPLFAGLLSSVSGMIEAAAKYRQYRKTVNELSELTGKELADLGLSHSTIKSVAMEAVYGA